MLYFWSSNFNYQDVTPSTSRYPITGRNCQYHTDNQRFYQPEQLDENYEEIQNRQNPNNYDDTNISPPSSSLGFSMQNMVPDPDDVKTIAMQMRTMPNYFAAMAAAVSVNVNYQHPSNAPDNESGHSSLYRQEQDIPRLREKYSDKTFQSGSTPLSISTANSAEEEGTNSHLTSPLTSNVELRNMVCYYI